MRGWGRVMWGVEAQIDNAAADLNSHNAQRTKARTFARAHAPSDCWLKFRADEGFVEGSE